MHHHARAEEYLALSDTVQALVYRKDLQDLHAGLTCVHKAFGNAPRREDLVSLSELLEEDPVWEALSADTDSLQHSIALQLF